MSEPVMRSVMLTHWVGGGAPNDRAYTITLGAFTDEDLRQRVVDWLTNRLGLEPMTACDHEEAAPEPAAVPISDVPLGLWPMLEDFEEDLTDAAA